MYEYEPKVTYCGIFQIKQQILEKSALNACGFEFLGRMFKSVTHLPLALALKKLFIKNVSNKNKAIILYTAILKAAIL